MSFNSDVKKVSRLETNKNCVDCGCVNPQWASITYGIFICLECASNHRSYGVAISKVRSVNMDSWDEKTYNIMKEGGNERFIKYLKENDIYITGVKERYTLPETKIYAEQLEDKVNKILGLESKPVQEKTVTTATRTVMNESNNMGYTHVEKKTYNATRIYQNTDGYNKTKNSHNPSSFNTDGVNTMEKISGIIKENAILLKDKGLMIGGRINESLIRPATEIIIEKGRVLYSRWKKEEVIPNRPDENRRKAKEDWEKWD